MTAPAMTECPHCMSTLPRRAKRCPACGQYAVPTQLRPAALVLRIVGYVWIVLSLLGAAVLWQSDLPFPGGRTSLAIVAGLQGLLLGLIAVTIAENGRREPE